MARIPKLDAAGKFLAADVNAQIDARAKAATAPLLDGKRGVEATELGTEHLDTVTTPGTYTQSANLEATLETGYPMTRGGVLQVERSVSKTMVWQTYTTYAPSPSTPAQTWQRGSYNGTWTPWSQVGGGSGSGIEQVSGTVTLDATGPAIREFFTTGATTFKANGADTLLSSFTAVVWRRNSQGSWGYQVVQDSWTTPAPTPDTTAPVAGTLAVAVTDVKADLTVSGASDDRGYVSYSFSKDNGSTWTGYQDGSTYTFTGLSASTAYQFRHRVKDAAGNVTTGTAVSKTTAAAPPNPYETAALSMGVQYFGRLDAGSGVSEPNRGAAGGSITLSGPKWGAPGVTGYDKAQTDGLAAFSNHIPTGTPAYTAAVALRVSKSAPVIADWSSKNRVAASTTGPWTLTGPTAGPVTGGNAAVVGNVYHVAITWDGAVSKLYVDGVQVASVADPGPVTQAAFMTFQAAAGPINGVVYDTSRALTAAQIKQLSDAVTR